MSYLKIDDVSFGYGDRKAVLSHIDLSVEKGSFVSLLGPSGCGKSTLLRLIAGLESPHAGSIAVNGLPIEGPGLDRGMVFQDYSLFPWMTVGENIELGLRQANPGKKSSQCRELASEFLELVNLRNVYGSLPRQLSGGMRQRAAIARTLALGSPILLLDEPFGALDPVNRLAMQDLLHDLCQHADPVKTVVFVTHDVEEALFLGDRVVMLGAASGHVIADLPVAFPGKRRREQLYASDEFSKLRNAIFESYHRDVQSVLEENISITSIGQGI